MKLVAILMLFLISQQDTISYWVNVHNLTYCTVRTQYNYVHVHVCVFNFYCVG